MWGPGQLMGKKHETNEQLSDRTEQLQQAVMPEPTIGPAPEET